MPALRAIQLLHQTIAAIWCVHGEAMGKAAFGEAATALDEQLPAGAGVRWGDDRVAASGGRDLGYAARACPT